MPGNKLRNQLFRLLELISSESIKWASVNGFSEEKTPYVRTEVIDYEYPSSSVIATDVHYLKTNKDLNRYHEFLGKIKEMPAYANCLATLVTVYELTETDAENKLFKFIHKSLSWLDEDAIRASDESFLTMISNNFINELEGLPNDHNIKIFLGGILLKQKLYNLSNAVCQNMVIRRPDLPDLWLERKDWPEYSYHSDFIPVEATAILEFTHPCFTPREADAITRNLYNILLLHRVSSITNLRVDLEIKFSFLYGLRACTSFSSYHDRPNLIYEYTDDDVERLRFLIESLYQNIGIIRTDLDKGKQSNDFSYLEYAFVMYKEALLQHANNRIRIAFTVTALETLFKAKDEYYYRNGKKVPNFKIVGKRAKSLLKAVEYKTDNLIDTISKAYRIRDAMYHGFEIDPEILRDEVTIYRSLLDYLRVSLQILIQLKYQKPTLIEQIDNLRTAPKHRALKSDFGVKLKNEIFVS